MFYRKVIPLIITMSFWFAMTSIGHADNSKTLCEKKEEKEHQVMGPLSVQSPEVVNVHLKTTFLDGISIVRVVDDHFISTDALVAKYTGWQLAKCHEKDVFLFKKVNDLSPVSKTAGIFGLNDGNILTLYKGSPKEKQIIQTFFQIDVNAMEADAAKKLKQGIRITDKDQYRDLLQSLSKFAISNTPKDKRRS